MMAAPGAGAPGAPAAEAKTEFDVVLEGFGDKAERYVEQMREHAQNMAVLRYGFQFRKTDVSERMFRDPIEAVVARTKSEVQDRDEPLSAVIHGVDDA